MLRKIGGIVVSLSLMSTLAGCATVVGTISGTFHANMFGAEEVPPRHPEADGGAHSPGRKGGGGAAGGCARSAD
jgi:hypothetical protein